MSKKHPIVAVTGSSGAGTTTVKRAFEHIFYRDGISAAVIEGDSFHRYDRAEMKAETASAAAEGRNLSHFGPEANRFDLLAELFRTYGETGTGKKRYYIHSDEEAAEHNARLGTQLKAGPVHPLGGHARRAPTCSSTRACTAWWLPRMTTSPNTSTWASAWCPSSTWSGSRRSIATTLERGYSAEAIVDTIMRRMPDYIRHITPQFSLTDINFQRVATVDTSNPFIARDIPTPDESFVIIRFREPGEMGSTSPICCP